MPHRINWLQTLYLLSCHVFLTIIFVANGLAQTANLQITNGSQRVEVPGVVITHSPASSGKYIGSPSIAVLPDGAYVASHDFFGPKTTEHSTGTTVIFRSQDHGKTWQKAAQIERAFWSNLFVHQNHLYLLGTTKHHGLLVIRRSDDGGKTWTNPQDGETGLLTESGEYHTAPVPILIHQGRIWRAVEDAGGGKQWGSRYRAMAISAAVDADLLKSESWTFSNYVSRDASWMQGRFQAFLEGNMVVAPNGQLYDVLRMHYGGPGGKTAMVRISDDGTTASFDPKSDIIDFPGGAKKFTIRLDPKSKSYWALSNVVVPIATEQQSNAGSVRNSVALMRSTDLRDWEMKCILLYHPDVAKHAFQYPDWQFEGADIIAAIRTAYDDEEGGAHRGHDANYLTFHRFKNFRDLAQTDSVVDPQSLELPPENSIDTKSLLVVGRRFTLQKLENDRKAFANRDYVWKETPAHFKKWKFTQTSGGIMSKISVTAKTDTTVYVAVSTSTEGFDQEQWETEPDLSFHYSDAGRTKMHVLSRRLKSGQTFEISQKTWSGTLLLIPPELSD